MRRLLIVCICFIVAGCMGVRNVPQSRQVEISRIYNLPYDEVWPAIVEIFAEKNIPIRTIEKNSGIIAGEPSNVPWEHDHLSLRSKFCDCGHPGGMVALVGLHGQCNIFVKKLSDMETSVQVNTIYKADVYDPFMKQITFQWDCQTTGSLERNLLDRIETKLNK